MAQRPEKKKAFCQMCGKPVFYRYKPRLTCSQACRLRKHKGEPHFLDRGLSDFFESITTLDDAILQKGFRLDENEARMIEQQIAVLQAILDKPVQKVLF